MSNNKITYTDLKKALREVKKANLCAQCKTNKDFIVLGYFGLYCKCEANKLAKTRRAKHYQNMINQLLIQNGKEN